MLQIRDAELPLAGKLLQHLIEETTTLATVDEDDVRLEGKLRLVLELVQGMDCRSIGSSSGLVHLLITGQTSLWG